MTHSFDIIFDPDRTDPGRAFLASIVITPVDAFDGRVVSGPIKARIARLEKTATRTLSGHLVFERLEEGKDFTVSLDPTDAGYFAPADRDIPVPQPRVAPGGDPAGDTRVVGLIRMPEFVRDGEAMILRGGVQDAAGEDADAVVLNAEVRLFEDPDDPDPPQPIDPMAPPLRFTTRTNAKGNFAMRMHAPRVSLANAPRLPVICSVTLQIGADEVWAGEIKDLSTRVIPDPIPLP